MDDLNTELLKLSASLATLIGRNSVQAVTDRMKAARASKNQEEVIRNLEGIITDLIADKTDLSQIAQAYDEQLQMRKMSEDEIDYVTENIIPLLETLLNLSEDEAAIKARDAIALFKPILSKDTFNILQLLGFNFNQAIGQPLTRLVSSLILSKIPLTAEKMSDYQILLEQRQIEFLKMVQNREAFECYQMILRSPLRD